MSDWPVFIVLVPVIALMLLAHQWVQGLIERGEKIRNQCARLERLMKIGTWGDFRKE